MTERVPRWIDELTDHVRCSPSFVRELDAQLAAQFRDRTGLDLADFVLAPDADMFAVRRHGPVGYVVADLVGSYSGFPVTIAWAAADGQRFVEPHEEVAAGAVRWWWHALPADELVEEERRWPEPPFDVARLPFAVDFKLKVWPHVRFTLGLRQPVDDAARAQLDDALWATLQESWERADGPGMFHDVGVAEPVDDHTVQIDIDLGSTGPAGMVHVLDRLAATGLVASVAIRAY